MTFELSRLPDELILKMTSLSSQVWLKLALAVPFIGRWALDECSIKRIRRDTPLPKIECWHYNKPSRSTPDVPVCLCRPDTCVHLSRELAAFLGVHPDSRIQYQRILHVVLEYIRFNRLLSCKMLPEPCPVEGPRCREYLKTDARLSTLFREAEGRFYVPEIIPSYLVHRHTTMRQTPNINYGDSFLIK
jgi:hypothetical protein